jgi:hypothetical protein
VKDEREREREVRAGLGEEDEKGEWLAYQRNKQMICV